MGSILSRNGPSDKPGTIHVVVESSYDAASRLTGLTYKHGINVLGTLTYTYDAAGQRIAVGGSWARTGLPAALASATYSVHSFTP
jgi:YD repeat-containing protein